MDCVNTQKVMTAAYDKWVHGMSHNKFVMSLAPNERRAVVIGNLNYQVGNGGFIQWDDNQYSKNLSFLEDALEVINTDSSKQVLSIVKEFMKCLEKQHKAGYDSTYDDMANECDNKYYAIQDKFLNDVESFFSV